MTDARLSASQTVLAWLRAQGYPLEMRTARVLRDNGWGVQHAVWYQDRETGKPRELDLVASVFAGRGHPLSESATLELAIECKSSPNKPWVTFASPPSKFSVEGLSFVDAYSHDVWIACSGNVQIPAIARLETDICHGIARAHADNRTGDPTAPFAAVQSVMAAAWALGRNHAELALDSNGAAPGAVLIVPMVVLDGLLFRYSMDASGTEALVEVPHAAVRVASDGWFGQATIRVVTLDALAALLKELTPGAQSFVESVAPIAKNAFLSLQSRVEAVGRERVLGETR